MLYRHILLPTDGSEPSERALRECVRFAKLIGAGVTALHVTPRMDRSVTVPHTGQVLKLVADIARAAGVPCGTLHRVGDVLWDEIVRVACELGCDLIFMASHDDVGVEKAQLDRETNMVLTHSKVSVLVCR